jgi:hypothetical protein
LGVTATAQRTDEIGLEHVFEEIVYARSLREMIDQGYLSRLRAVKIETTNSLDCIHTNGGDFIEAELSATLNNPARNQLAVKACRDFANDRQVLVFAIDVKHASDLSIAYQAAGFSAAVLTGATPLDIRRRIIEDFRAGRLQVLTNCMVLTEGFDAPEISCVVLARPTKSSLLYRQMVGRGTRLASGKDDCLIVDLVDQTTRHTLVTIPSLFGLPPAFDAGGTDIVATARDVEAWVRRSGDDPDHLQSLDEIDLDASEVRLWEEDTSSHGWHYVVNNRVRAFTGGLRREYVVVWREPGGWRIKLGCRRHQARRIEGTRFLETFTISPSPTLGVNSVIFERVWGTMSAAINEADNWIDRCRAGSPPFTLSGARYIKE